MTGCGGEEPVGNSLHAQIAGVHGYAAVCVFAVSHHFVGATKIIYVNQYCACIFVGAAHGVVAGRVFPEHIGDKQARAAVRIEIPKHFFRSAR